MQDLISRQAAIDAFADYIHDVNRLIGKSKLLSAHECEDIARRVLRKLPSVQPEHERNTASEQPVSDRFEVKTGATCTDTISRQAAMDAIMSIWGYADEMYKALNELPSVQHWIPCADRLPDTDCRVLCLTKTKKGIINYVIGYYADDRWCCGMNSNVVAWMELPAPPEEDKQ